MAWKVPLFKIYSDSSDVEAVRAVLERGAYWTMGPEVEELEGLVAREVGVKHAVSFSNGTCALHAAMLAHGIKKGDEVIVPSFTFISTANAPLFVGAKPVFADIEEGTYGLDPADLRRKITEKTKAIIPVHYGGGPCMIEEIREIAEENGLLVVEDCAESLGAKLGKKSTGAFGDSAIFSFCQNKVVSTGEGGCVATDSKQLFEKLLLIRSHGRLDTKDYFSTPEYMDYVQLGYNFRMSSITAAVGVSQMKKIDKIIEMRRDRAGRYGRKLRKLDFVERVPEVVRSPYHVFQLYTIEVAPGARDALKRHLAERGVMTKVYFDPVHKTHFYKDGLHYRPRLPATERLAARVLSLPIYPHMTDKEMDCVIECMEDFKW